MAPIHRVSTGFLLSVWVSAASAFDYGAAPNPSVELGSYQTGWSPEQRLVFDVLAGELETYRVVIRYPDGFRFDGFDMLGPLNTPVGAYELDFNYDGVPERTVTLRSLGSDAAYADVIDDQRFTPTFEPVLGQAIGHEFHMRLPFGGDADSQSLVAPFGVWMRLVLFAGLLVNPATGGDYTVNAALTSVDPDSDGADDGAGAAPLNLALAFPVTIEDPQQIALARFVIDEATVELNSRTHDRFMVKGCYALGSASDGLDPA